MFVLSYIVHTYTLSQNFVGHVKSAKATKKSKYKLTSWARLTRVIPESQDTTRLSYSHEIIWSRFGVMLSL